MFNELITEAPFECSNLQIEKVERETNGHGECLVQRMSGHQSTEQQKEESMFSCDI